MPRPEVKRLGTIPKGLIRSLKTADQGQASEEGHEKEEIKWIVATYL